MLKVRCRIQKCWPVRKWLWNVQSEMLQRWLDLVSVETIYIYLGIFRGRFCRFWERGLEVSKDGWTLFLSKLFISIQVYLEADSADFGKGVYRPTKMAGRRFCRNYLYLSGYIQRPVLSVLGKGSQTVYVYLEAGSTDSGKGVTRCCRFCEGGHTQTEVMPQNEKAELSRHRQTYIHTDNTINKEDKFS